MLLCWYQVDALTFAFSVFRLVENYIIQPVFER